MRANHLQDVVERFYADIWNRHDKSQIPLLLCADFTFRGSLGPQKTGHEGFAEYLDFVHRALDEYRCNIVDLVVEPPKAFARMRFSGIHRGEFFGYPPTGNPLEWAGSALFSFKDGKVADLWVLGDLHGLLQRLDWNTGIQRIDRSKSSRRLA